MLRYWKETFLEPRRGRWFRSGLVIESASGPVADLALRKLARALPGIRFNLLSRRSCDPERTLRVGDGPEFHDKFRIKRPFGGLRLVLKARRHYDLVVFFASGEKELRLCRAMALAVMRPRRFFVFNEFGEGFWLHRNNWTDLTMHLERRYDVSARRRRWEARMKAVIPAVGGLFMAVCSMLARLPVRAVQVGYSAVLFTVAVTILLLLRLTYDARRYRFRFFRKAASAPRRNLKSGAQATELVASLKPPTL